MTNEKMQNSGTKLVLALLGLALVLGVISWWYRYEAAHRVTQFWGAEASRLIAESEGFEATIYWPRINVSGSVMIEKKDLSKARGQAHLRHALLSDRNYVWDPSFDKEKIRWRWLLRFHEGERDMKVVLSDDLKAIGEYRAVLDGQSAISCEPMTESLTDYFRALGLFAKPSATASTASE